MDKNSRQKSEARTAPDSPTQPRVADIIHGAPTSKVFERYLRRTDRDTQLQDAERIKATLKLRRAKKARARVRVTKRRHKRPSALMTYR